MSLAVILELDADRRETVAALGRVAERIEGAVTTESLGVAPHLTLAVYPDRLEPELTEVCGRFAELIAPIPVAFSSLLYFPTEGGALCLGPAPLPDLLRCHATFHDAAAGLRQSCHAHFSPEAWVPHVTLVRNLTGSAVGTVMADVQARWTPIAGTLDSVVLVSFHPVVEVARFDLSIR